MGKRSGIAGGPTLGVTPEHLCQYAKRLSDGWMGEVIGGRRVLWITRFRDGSGVTLSAFAELSGAPATTLRHYLRLGLISTLSLHGKFRFLPLNTVQLEMVSCWVACGVTLAEVVNQRKRFAARNLSTHSMMSSIDLIYEYERSLVPGTLKELQELDKVTAECIAEMTNCQQSLVYVQRHLQLNV